MGKVIQLELFEHIPPSSLDLERQLEKTQVQVNNLRRGLFKRYDDLRKDIEEIKKLLAKDESKSS